MKRLHGTWIRLGIFLSPVTSLSSQATDKVRYTHVGNEFNLDDMIFVRAGMNQGYWTGNLS